MHKSFLFLLLLIFNLSYAQPSREDIGIADPYGLINYFNGIPLYKHRAFYEPNFTGLNSEYTEMSDDTKLLITIDSLTNTLTIMNDIFTITRKVKPKNGKVTYDYKAFKKFRDITLEILEEGNFIVHFLEMSNLKYSYHYDIAGLGVKCSYYNQHNQKVWTQYYETEKEHKKTSAIYPVQKHPRIITIGESATAWDNIFRFAVTNGTQIKITSQPSDFGSGTTYLTLHDSDGKVLKQTDGMTSLFITYTIPNDGFYYISTMISGRYGIALSLSEE